MGTRRDDFAPPVSFEDLLRAQGIAAPQAAPAVAPVTVNVGAAPASQDAGPSAVQLLQAQGLLPSAPPQVSPRDLSGTGGTGQGWSKALQAPPPSDVRVGEPEIDPGVQIGEPEIGPQDSIGTVPPPVDQTLQGSPQYQVQPKVGYPSVPFDPRNSQVTVGQPTIGGPPLPETPQQKEGPPTVPPPIDRSIPGSPQYQAQTPQGQAPTPPQAPTLVQRRTQADLLSPFKTDAAGNPLADAQGNPIPKSPDDVQRDTVLAGQDATKDVDDSLDAEERAELEANRRMGAARITSDAEQAELSRKRAEMQDLYLKSARDSYDAMRAAQARADASFPNPDDLLGGKGSWSRAVSIGMAMAGIPGAADMLNAQLQLQWGGRTAAYERQRQQVLDAQGNIKTAGDLMKTEDDALISRQNAGLARLANTFGEIGDSVADPATKAKYAQLRSDLVDKIAMNRAGAAAANAKFQLEVYKAETANEKLYTGKYGLGRGSAGGASGIGDGSVVTSAENPFGKLGVREPDRNGHTGGWWKAASEDAAKKAMEQTVEYGRLDDSLNDMDEISREAAGAKSTGGQVWDKWQSERDAKYKVAFINAAQLAARVLHGRPPGKFTMTEVEEEFPGLAKAWETNNVEGIVKYIRDLEDRQYNKTMHTYGYNGTYVSDRPGPAETPNSNTIRRDASPDYVPGFMPNIQAIAGGGADPNNQKPGAIDAYMENFWNNRKRGDSDKPEDNSVLIGELREMQAKQVANQKRAELDAAREKPGTERHALLVRIANAYAGLVDAYDQKIKKAEAGKPRVPGPSVPSQSPAGFGP